MPGFESDPVFHAEIKSKSGYQWNYILRDHLGNTRVVFADKNKDGLIRQDSLEAQNEVLSISNYSPFGLELGGSHQNLKQQFEYKFNGKQENGFSGLIDFGGRYLDKHLGVWAQVDPKSERFFNQSTRNFTFNNPIRFIDPDGRAPFDIILFGANNSSVTVKTDLVDVKINASGLGVDFGGNYTLSGNDVLQAAVDIGGVFDPSGALDVFGAKMSYDNGDYWGAGASLLGAGLPFVGDLAKSGKIAKGIDKISGAIKSIDGYATGSHEALNAAKLKDSHHIIQDASVRDLPNYNRKNAPVVQLEGPSTKTGTPHYNATRAQRQSGGGTYASERRIGYRALREAGVPQETSKKLIRQADDYFKSIGVTSNTPTRIPGNRN